MDWRLHAIGTLALIGGAASIPFFVGPNPNPAEREQYPPILPTAQPVTPTPEINQPITQTENQNLSPKPTKLIGPNLPIRTRVFDCTTANNGKPLTVFASDTGTHLTESMDALSQVVLPHFPPGEEIKANTVAEKTYYTGTELWVIDPRESNPNRVVLRRKLAYLLMGTFQEDPDNITKQVGFNQNTFKRCRVIAEE